MHARSLAAGVALASMLALPRGAAAFCRTMACPLPPDFMPSPGSCIPDGFANWCATGFSQPYKPIPVWWRNACIGYDVQQDASPQVPYATADQDFAAAFARWTSIRCPGGGGDGGEGGRVSIDVRDLGPVACDEVQYNQDQGNQHVIIFRSQAWPYNDSANTLGLTTITYDPDTGEIYDADMEINATVPLTLGDPVPMDGYDFLSIITHESGHFLGMAHSGDQHATMFARYTPGSTAMRTLTADDVAGLCSIYRPDGVRVVDPSVTTDGSGRIEEGDCDPTPRHGFSAQCAQPSSSKSCDVSAHAGSPPAGFVALGAAGVGAAFARRRRRQRPRDRGPA